MMGYSYDIRRSLARIGQLLGNPAAERRWSEAAVAVRSTTIANLWRDDHGAMFDRDAEDRWVTTLCHNNLRMMWHGLFTQQMADTFVARHLMNTSEFWTKMPLVSIAISDHRYKNVAGNNWAGQPQGLTVQRAIRGLESYTHLAELTLVGRSLEAALKNGCADDDGSRCHFPQQIDPATAIPQTTHPDDGYGPMMLSFLELTALRAGIVPRPDGVAGAIFWSGVADGGVTTSYLQQLGDRKFTLSSNATVFVGVVDGVVLFTCTAGVRVITELGGTVTAVAGIDTVPHSIMLTAPHPSSSVMTTVKLTVHPNEVWAVDDASGPKLARAAPFTAPHP